MKPANRNLEFVRYFVPVLLSLLTIRMLYLNGGLSLIFAVLCLPFAFMFWILTGGVLSLLDTLFWIRPFIAVASAWFKYFSPDHPRMRGRQLIEPKPQGSLGPYNIGANRDEKSNEKTARRKSRVHSTEVRR